MLVAAYQMFLILLIVVFGMISIGLKEEEHCKIKNHFAQLSGIGIVGLLATFWLT
ncbi:hypothetical protein MHZ95_05090 [Sporosarcina sp. ACRSM]|uniref:hypothetical protein n=1 Tax=Sporosarcina sp. ACRSM TaxID=2918216 RepID=UPI001EF74496|nr:hypothetical protein [Sporosarcina sp. ACRSM]MCG7334657.1 hypothetical protein [Sporosarcina sp. ACRSM]